MCILYRLRTVMADWKTRLETERKQVSLPEGNALQFLTYFLPKHLNATLSKNFFPTLTTKNTSGTYCVHFFTDLTQWRLHVVITSPALLNEARNFKSEMPQIFYKATRTLLSRLL
jgi:hypothetical protein